jgi:hypothetical protein
MASGDLFGYYLGKDLVPQNGLAYEVPLSPGAPPSSTGGPATGMIGVPLNKDAIHAYQLEGRVNVNGAPLTTGLTFSLSLVDDPMNPNPGGAGAISLGVSVKRIVSGTSDLTQTSFGTEVVTTVTMPATSGVVLIQAVAVANANLGSLAAGNHFVVQVRRIGTNAADTHQGVVLCTGVSISDT